MSSRLALAMIAAYGASWILSAYVVCAKVT
jgi:hypothetical protein